MNSLFTAGFFPFNFRAALSGSVLMVLAFSFTSCAHYYYAPNSTNIPLLKENEAKLNFQYAGGTISEGFEMQSAFAVSKNFAGMVNTMFTGSTYDEYIDESEKTNTRYIEFAGGYFTPVKNTSLVFETYGGIGWGGVQNQYSTGRSTVGFTKYFLQPNIGVKVKGFEFGISSRFNYVNHYIKTNSLPETDPDQYKLAYLNENPTSFLWEPGVVLRFGGKKFMVQLQYTTSVNFSHSDESNFQELAYVGIGGSFPISYKIPN